MFITENDNTITIILPDELSEDTIPEIIHKLKEHELDKKKKIKNKKIHFDLERIEQIDFFGYQHLYSFYHYLENTITSKHLTITEKPPILSEFESKLGLKLEN